MSVLFLCCAKTLHSQIEDLSKSGKKGKLAAELCLQILEEIRNDGPSGNYLVMKRTKSGEARIDKCVKYDLGAGYRLITIRCKNHLFVPFAGTHDKADLWLQHNRLDDIGKKIRSYEVEKLEHVFKPCSGEPDLPSAGTIQDEYEKKLFSNIDQAMLRQIFKGLVDSGKDRCVRNGNFS